LDSGDEDLRALGLLSPATAESSGGRSSGLAWQDEGYWLLLPLLLLALFAFRRGGVLALLLVWVVLPPQQAQAADLWRRPDQAAYARMQRGNEAYRHGDYSTATREYEGLRSATAQYNRGNALAKAGRYPQAIAAYEQALRLQPGMGDALANKRAVEAAMKRRPPSGSNGGQGQSQRQGGQSQNEPQQNPQQSQQRSPQQSQQNSRQDSQQNSQQRQQTPPPEQAQSEQTQAQPAKPQDAKAQAEADRAQRERMQRALRQQGQAQTARQRQKAKEEAKETPEQRERRLANEAWLRRVPDDPGGLLRAKFRLELERRAAKGKVEE
jgi:Ca-activated chloride channel family protein